MARYKFQFWLNGAKDDELLVAETVDELKRRRSFSAVVRDGIMIVNELRQGNIDLLLKLYPWVMDAIAERLPPPVPPQPPPIDTDTLLQQIRMMMLERDRGEDIPDTRDGGFPAMMPATKQLSKGISAHVITMPVILDDEDEDTIVLTKATGGKSNAENFMASMANIAY